MGAHKKIIIGKQTVIFDFYQQARRRLTIKISYCFHWVFKIHMWVMSPLAPPHMSAYVRQYQ